MNRTDAELIADLTARLNAPKVNWVSAYHKRDAIRTDEAAAIADCSDQTVRRYVDQAEEAGRPIGVVVARSIYLIDLQMWLDEIERRHGYDDRLAAEKRVEKALGLRLAQQILTRSITTATG